MASLDLNTGRWSRESSARLPMQLHHHGAWFDAEKGQYTLFGGFGNMRYSKSFYAYDLNTHEWSVLDGFGGDSLCPRYFSSVGYSRSHDAVYIFGGMGNESGEQVVGRYYFTTSTVWTWPHAAFANSGSCPGRATTWSRSAAW